MAKLQYPYFAKGTLDDLNYALQSGEFKDLDRVSFCFLTDSNKLAFIDIDKTIHLVAGNNTNTVIRVDALPPISQGNTSTLYILGSTVYSFDGVSYIPTYQDITPDIQSLQSDVQALQNWKISVDQNIAAIGYAMDQKADKATSLSGYGISDAYTKDEISGLIGDMGSSSTVSEYVETEVQDNIDNAMKITVVK